MLVSMSNMKRRYRSARKWSRKPAHFRLWRRKRKNWTLLSNTAGRSRTFHPLTADQVDIFPALSMLGRHSLLVPSKRRRKLYPDPASRFQPRWPHGPSCIVDQNSSNGPTRSGRARSPRFRRQIILRNPYRHVTKDGTWGAAAEQL